MKNLLTISNGVNNTFIINPSLPVIHPLILKLKFNLKVFGILSFFSILTLLAFYIFQINSVVSEGYQIKNYEKKLNELSRENETLEINSIQINSLRNIEEKIKELGFEKVGPVHYIRVLESQIVKE